MSFKEASSKPMPRLACVGRVTEVPEAFVSKKGVYVVQRVVIEGYGPSKNTKPMILYRTDWFTDGFDPESLLELEEGSKLLAVYRNNISERGKISTLKGLCGCDTEKFDELAGRIFGLGLTVEDDIESVMSRVTEVLSTFLVDEKGGDQLGYILGQQTSKTDEVNAETGKAIYVAEPYYEVKEFFDPQDEKKIASLVKSANKSDGKFKITFDDTPF